MLALLAQSWLVPIPASKLRSDRIWKFSSTGGSQRSVYQGRSPTDCHGASHISFYQTLYRRSLSAPSRSALHWRSRSLPKLSRSEPTSFRTIPPLARTCSQTLIEYGSSICVSRHAEPIGGRAGRAPGNEQRGADKQCDHLHRKPPSKPSLLLTWVRTEARRLSNYSVRFTHLGDAGMWR